MPIYSPSNDCSAILLLQAYARGANFEGVIHHSDEAQDRVGYCARQPQQAWLIWDELQGPTLPMQCSTEWTSQTQT